MKKKIIGIAVLVCLLLFVGGCFACRRDGTRVVFTTGFGKDEIFRIENESCKKAEVMVYLTTVQNQYENVYGEEIWKTDFEGVTLEENIKETVLARIAQVKTMYLLAKQKGITLDEAETETIKEVAGEYFNSLNEKEKEAMGIDYDTVLKLYEEYALAEKVYNQLVANINPEISDDEARIITVQHILLKTYVSDGAGGKISLSPEQILLISHEADKLHEQAISENCDFEKLAEKNSDDGTITYSFAKGEMDPAFEEAAFRLETGEISEVVRSESGFHIIKCLNTFDREETDANKLKMVEKRRQEAFGEEYNAFVQTLARNLNRDLWEKTELIYDPEVKTDNFFEVYEKHFYKNFRNGNTQ